MKKSLFTAEKTEALPIEFTSKNVELLKTIKLLERIALKFFDSQKDGCNYFPPILFVGSEGSGKALLARWLGKKREPFLEICCAAHAENGGLEAFSLSELVQRAEGGVLFLNGVEALRPEEQAFWLNACESREGTPQAFQLVSSASPDWQESVKEGSFRADFAALMSTWMFFIPALSQRPEDWPTLVEAQLTDLQKNSEKILKFQPEALQKFLRFSASLEAVWSSGIRDLKASVSRMIVLAVLSEQDSISSEIVSGEIARLRALWTGKLPALRLSEPSMQEHESSGVRILGQEKWDALDRFDRVQLADVLEVCRLSPNLSEAGRVLFSNSRLEKKTSNDTDRLRKYLLKFGIGWSDIQKIIDDFQSESKNSEV